MKNAINQLVAKIFAFVTNTGFDFGLNLYLPV